MLSAGPGEEAQGEWRAPLYPGLPQVGPEQAQTGPRLTLGYFKPDPKV